MTAIRSTGSLTGICITPEHEVKLLLCDGRAWGQEAWLPQEFCHNSHPQLCVCCTPSHALWQQRWHHWSFRLSPCLPVQGVDIKNAFKKFFGATPYLECGKSNVSGDPYDVGQDWLPLTSRWECCVYCHFSVSIRLDAESFSRHPSVWTTTHCLYLSVRTTSISMPPAGTQTMLLTTHLADLVRNGSCTITTWLCNIKYNLNIVNSSVIFCVYKYLFNVCELLAVL